MIQGQKIANERGNNMKLSEYKSDYKKFSGKASDLTRQLCFAGIAAIWLFKSGTDLSPIIPTILILSGICFITALAADLLQYVSASIIWSAFYRIKEKESTDPDEDIKASSWLNKPVYFFFYAKIILTMVGYILLVKHLISII
jgi:hypothetical protein